MPLGAFSPWRPPAVPPHLDGLIILGARVNPQGEPGRVARMRLVHGLSLWRSSCPEGLVFITGGPLAGIPLVMVLSPKTVTVPTTGQSMVVFIVSLEYRGPETELAELGYELARRRVEHKVRMEVVEEVARKQLVAPHQEPVQEQEDTAAEFFPAGEAAETASPEPRSDTNGDDPLLPPSPGLDATGAEDAFPAEQVYVIPQETKRPEPQEEVPPGWDSVPHGGPSTAAPPKQRGGSNKPKGRGVVLRGEEFCAPRHSSCDKITIGEGGSGPPSL